MVTLAVVCAKFAILLFIGFSPCFVFQSLVVISGLSTVNSEIFMRIFFSRIPLKDIFDTLKSAVRT